MDYIFHLLIISGIYIILGVSLNLVVGFNGFISVAHAAFFGIGAYATAILMTSFGFNFFIAALVGIIISGLLAVPVGLIISRLKGDQYVLGTLGFGYIATAILINWESLTNGALGIAGITRPEIAGFVFGQNSLFFIIVLLCVAAVINFCVWLTNTSFGRVLKAIREDERTTQVLGYYTPAYKLVTFIIAAALAAISGALYASYIGFINPIIFEVLEAVFILSIVVLGGFASIKGSAIAAVILVVVPELFRFIGLPQDIAPQIRQLMYGLLLVLAMLYRPKGIAGEYSV